MEVAIVSDYILIQSIYIGINAPDNQKFVAFHNPSHVLGSQQRSAPVNPTDSQHKHGQAR